MVIKNMVVVLLLKIYITIRLNNKTSILFLILGKCQLNYTYQMYVRIKKTPTVIVIAQFEHSIWRFSCIPFGGAHFPH